MNKTIITAGVAATLAVGVVLIINYQKPPTAQDSPSNTETTPAEEKLTIPTIVPLYPQAEIIKQTDTVTIEETNITLTLKTADPQTKVIDWYRQALSNDGWQVSDDRNIGGYTLLDSVNGNFKIFTQFANSETGDTIITERIRER